MFDISNTGSVYLCHSLLNEVFMKSLSYLLILSFIAVSCRHNNSTETVGTIPVIGKNPQGQVSVDHVPQAFLVKKLNNFSQQIQEETLGVLDQHISQTPWDLTRLTVGLKLESEVEVFEVFEVEGEAQLEFRFQKKS